MDRCPSIYQSPHNVGLAAGASPSCHGVKADRLPVDHLNSLNNLNKTQREIQIEMFIIY